MSTIDQSHAGAAHCGDSDAQLAFIYQEALRGLAHQQNIVESLNTRAGNLIFATAFATSLLGTRALQNGLGLWDWIAVASLLLIGALIAVMLWPYYNLTFRFDPAELLAHYVDGTTLAPMPVIHRELALRIKADMIGNWRTLHRIRIALQASLLLLLFEILAWLLSIGGL